MTDTIDNVEILFIRATKADCDNLERVRKVYQRFYLGRQIPSANRDTYIAGILMDICDKWMPIRASEVVNALNPEQAWMKGINEGDQYYTKVCKVLISHIRLQPVSYLPGFRIPAKFRN